MLLYGELCATLNCKFKKIAFINMENVNKNDVISKIDYDKSGYGSIATTYKDAKAKEPAIKLNDVKEWFSKNVEQKNSYEGQTLS